MTLYESGLGSSYKIYTRHVFNQFCFFVFLSVTRPLFSFHLTNLSSCPFYARQCLAFNYTIQQFNSFSETLIRSPCTVNFSFFKENDSKPECPGFDLSRHSSPSFGSQQVYFTSNPFPVNQDRAVLRPQGLAHLPFSAAYGFDTLSLAVVGTHSSYKFLSLLRFPI